jgi:hypothetical protein
MPQPLRSGSLVTRSKRCPTSTGNGAPPELQTCSDEKSQASIPGRARSAIHIVGTPERYVARLTWMSLTVVSTSKRGRSRTALPSARWRNMIVVSAKI